MTEQAKKWKTLTKVPIVGAYKGSFFGFVKLTITRICKTRFKKKDIENKEGLPKAQ
jgi:hypothetical protein